MRKIKITPVDKNNKHDKKCARVAEKILNLPDVRSEIEFMVDEYRKKIAREVLNKFKGL